MTEKITEKIKKLLRLSKSPNQHEAALALERAFELSSRHNIDLHALADDDDLKTIVHKYVKMGWHIPLDKKRAIDVVHRFFNVTPMFDHPNVVLIGHQSDIEIAEYVIEFLVRACRSCLKKYAENLRRLSTTRRASYIYGFFYGIYSQLDKNKRDLLQANSGLEIALRDENTKRLDYLNAHWRTRSLTISKKRILTSAMHVGYSDGRNLEIRKPVKAADATLLLTG